MFTLQLNGVLVPSLQTVFLSCVVSSDTNMWPRTLQGTAIATVQPCLFLSTPSAIKYCLANSWSPIIRRRQTNLPPLYTWSCFMLDFDPLVSPRVHRELVIRNSSSRYEKCQMCHAHLSSLREEGARIVRESPTSPAGKVIRERALMMAFAALWYTCLHIYLHKNIFSAQNWCACAIPAHAQCVRYKESLSSACSKFKMLSLRPMLHLCLVSALLGKLQAYPSSLQKSEQSTWFNLFAPDGSILQEEMEKFPLYEYGFEDYEYGDQIWSDCSKKSS